ncbi:MAG: PAS domain-containing sensor histidine kinase [Rhodospirillales bacterium]|nr:PAS domain-containing sensor histidine kinase [Rhodospirillales bacterium]
MKKKFRPKKKISAGSRRGLWLTSGLAQAMVLLNGIILTCTAFYILHIFINGISVEEYRASADDAGHVFMDGISDQENTVRLLSSVLLLSTNMNESVLSEQIRRNIPGLSQFDQVLWIYEGSPGKWNYKTLYESSHVTNKEASYTLVPSQNLITKIVQDKFFENDSLRVMSDLPGMNFVETKSSPPTMERPFSLVKVVKKNDSSQGVIFAVSRPEKLIDESWLDKESSICDLTIKDISSSKNMYSMENDRIATQSVAYEQKYNFFVGDGEWQITIQFTKKSNMLYIEQMPFLVLFFGIALTAIGTLFVRNNHKQAQRVSLMNKALEQKNLELETEISERERLNSALMKADKENRAVIDSVSDIIFETDTDGQILFLSASWRKITGFDVERSKGNNLFSMLNPEDQTKQKKEFDMMVRGQKQAYRTFTRLRTAEGTFRSIELAISMIRQDENKNLRVVGTITDVEERRRAERALAEAEKKYRTIVENAAGGLYQLTPEGIYLSANPSMARILGYKNVEELLHEVKNANGAVYIDKDERESFINALMRAGQINGYETQVFKKGGTKIWVSENIRCVKDEADNILYFEGSMEDITKRKEAEIALKDAKVQSDMANRSKTEFIANMSHELRTPLNAIIGFSEIMKNEVMGALGADMYRDYVKDIHKSGKGLLKIINEILDISKIESGDRELNESEFPFATLVETCLELNKAKVQDKGITVANNANDLPYLIGEELAVKQIIANIYSNAVKFTPEGGRITLMSTFDHNGSLRFSISDTGVGLTKDEIQKALSPFGQIDNALDRSGSGAGLGLTLSKSMMKLHGGDLEILSEKGIGTTVSLIFPAERISHRTRKESATETTPPPETKQDSPLQ